MDRHIVVGTHMASIQNFLNQKKRENCNIAATLYTMRDEYEETPALLNPSILQHVFDLLESLATRLRHIEIHPNLHAGERGTRSNVITLLQNKAEQRSCASR